MRDRIVPSARGALEERLAGACVPNGVRVTVVPGFVRSAYDGQRHYVSAGELCRLYKVPLRSVGQMFGFEDDAEQYGRFWRPAELALTPRQDGDYCFAHALKRWRQGRHVHLAQQLPIEFAAIRCRLDGLAARLEDFERRHPQYVPLIQERLREPTWLWSWRRSMRQLGDAARSTTVVLGAMRRVL